VNQRGAAIPGSGPPTQAGDPVLELVGVSKYYGNTLALSDINMSVHAGEVVGLVGDNGSGKSTLVKIAAGYHKPSRGHVRFRGVNVSFKSPADARARGVEVVYQDLALVDELSLWRNFFLRREVCWHLGPVKILRKGEMTKICRGKLDELGLLHIQSTDQMASALSGGGKTVCRDHARGSFRGGAPAPRRADGGAIGPRDRKRVEGDRPGEEEGPRRRLHRPPTRPRSAGGRPDRASRTWPRCCDARRAREDNRGVAGHGRGFP